MEKSKICRICGELKLLTDFYKEVRNRDGRTTYCRACRYPKLKEWRRRNAERPTPTGGEHFCTHCEQTLPISEFRADHSRKSGLSVWCRACLTEYKRNYYAQNKEKIATSKANSYRRNAEYIKNQTNARNREYRIKVLEHYGGKVPTCTCCGEQHIEFLCLDHINGGGNRHRREIGGGSRVFLWVIRNNFPAGFRVLCYNCNSSLGHYGYCPHDNSHSSVSIG